MIFGLSPTTLDYFGLRVLNIYYQTLDEDTETLLAEPIPIVYERYKYEWDETTNLPISQIKEIQFYLEDGSLDEDKKIMRKTFANTSDRAEITKRRRITIVDWLVARSKELGLGTALENFFNLYKDECDRYIQYEKADIIATVNSATDSWLDAPTGTEMGSVREAIVLCFTKALEATPDEEVTAWLASL